MVHYLTETGKGNFAVDTARGGSYYYDSLEDLERQMRDALLGGIGTATRAPSHPLSHPQEPFGAEPFADALGAPAAPEAAAHERLAADQRV